MMQIAIVHADSYCVLVDGDNTIVQSKNKDHVQSVASISKIMTAIIALEYGKGNEEWRVGSEIKQANGSMIYLKQGQKVSTTSLLYGLLLRSGNDAAIELATHIAGSEKAFVKKMNKKAAQIGMVNTLFRNASGLDEKDGGNISSAYDMALLMSYAMKNKTFRTITKTLYYTSDWGYRWKNKNRFMFSYPFANGGKTGFTKKAGRTLVTSARYGNVESIVVTLRTNDDVAFHIQQHQAVFAQYEMITLLKKGDYPIDGRIYHVKTPIYATVKKKDAPAIRVSMHVEDHKMIVEVQNKDKVDLYTYVSSKQKRIRFGKGFSL